MATISGVATLSYNDLYTNESTATPAGPLQIGSIAAGPHGKWFRYASVGETALVAGNLLQESAEDTQFENMAVTASAIATGTSGLQTVNVTNGTTTIEANDFDGGSIAVYTTPDLGREYTILGHTTGASGVAITVTVDRPLGTAWTTSTKIDMKRNPWSEVIQAPATTQTGMPVGVAIYASAASTTTVLSYSYVQTHGVASVLSDGSTFAVGSDVGTPSGTAGCVTVFAAGSTHTSVGIARQANASAHCIPVFLRID